MINVHRALPTHVMQVCVRACVTVRVSAVGKSTSAGKRRYCPAAAACVWSWQIAHRCTGNRRVFRLFYLPSWEPRSICALLNQYVHGIKYFRNSRSTVFLYSPFNAHCVLWKNFSSPAWDLEKLLTRAEMMRRICNNYLEILDTLSWRSSNFQHRNIDQS